MALPQPTGRVCIVFALGSWPMLYSYFSLEPAVYVFSQIGLARYRSLLAVHLLGRREYLDAARGEL
jgi:hypothetical protein